MRKVKFRWIIHLAIILVLGLFGWKQIHRTPEIQADIYPYLINIPPELVLQCQVEGKNLSSTGWADLIAVRTTLSSEQVAFVIQELQTGKTLEKVDWKSDLFDDEEQIKKVKWRRKILLKYPYYEPKRFAFPVIGDVWYEDSFGAPREGGARRHEGTDLFSPEGTPIISVCAGRVEKLGWNRLGGERVGVRGEDGNYYYYAHLQKIDESLKVGQKIEKGDPIGTMGHTGDALTTPDHLHFGIQLPNEEWINPYPLLYVWQKQEQSHS